jgi:cytidine deaminase
LQGEVDTDLIRQAAAVAVPRALGPTAGAASVGAALLAGDGRVFTGVCLGAACAVGFCAEQAAIGALVTAGLSRIDIMAAADGSGRVLPPCGRCRELTLQINPANRATRVLLPGGRDARLGDLMPDNWLDDRTKT